MDYSAEFKNLISDKEKARELINGSSYAGIHIQDWEKARMFIGKFINQDGTILDVGCANGFFLRCLQEWSGHTLEPFGIDLCKEQIEAAKKLFPSHPENFVQRNVFDISKIPLRSPREFDMVYWNVWENFKFESPREVRACKDILRFVKPGGRCMLGFYNGAETSAQQIRRIKELGFRLGRIEHNPTGIQMLTWIDVL